MILVYSRRSFSFFQATCYWTAGMILLSGCGSDNSPPTGIVTGIVTLDGEPLANASISFALDEGGRPSTGETRVDGTYELKFSATQKGALIGHHQVWIGTEKEGVPERLPEKYNLKTELTATVNAGHNKIDFMLNGNPASKKARPVHRENTSPTTLPTSPD